MRPGRRPSKRIFLGTVEVAGIHSRLAGGLVALGHEVVLGLVDEHPFRYEQPVGVRVPRTIRWSRALRSSKLVKDAPRRSARRVAVLLVDRAIRTVTLLGVAVRADAAVFLFGSSLVHPLEGVVLRAFGCRTIHILNGSDARPPCLDGYTIESTERVSTDELRDRHRAVDKQMRAVCRGASEVVALPGYSHFLTRPYVHFLWLGIPAPPVVLEGPDGTPRVTADGVPGPVRVLHAPSHRRSKGTARIREAIGRVRDEGVAFEFVELDGVPNEQVLTVLAGCDLVVDQAYSDYHLPVLATEAASVGVPTVVGTTHDACDDIDVPDDLRPPSMLVHPDEFESAIRLLVLDAELRRTLGESARRFVETTWSTEAVCRRLLALVDGTAEPLRCIPTEDDFGGCGLTEAEVRTVARQCVDAGIVADLFPESDALQKNFGRLAEDEQQPVSGRGRTANRSPSRPTQPK